MQKAFKVAPVYGTLFVTVTSSLVKKKNSKDREEHYQPSLPAPFSTSLFSICSWTVVGTYLLTSGLCELRFITRASSIHDMSEVFMEAINHLFINRV